MTTNYSTHNMRTERIANMDRRQRIDDPDYQLSVISQQPSLYSWNENFNQNRFYGGRDRPNQMPRGLNRNNEFYLGRPSYYDHYASKQSYGDQDRHLEMYDELDERSGGYKQSEENEDEDSQNEVSWKKDRPIEKEKRRAIRELNAQMVKKFRDLPFDAIGLVSTMYMVSQIIGKKPQILGISLLLVTLVGLAGSILSFYFGLRALRENKKKCQEMEPVPAEAYHEFLKHSRRVHVFEWIEKIADPVLPLLFLIIHCTPSICSNGSEILDALDQIEPCKVLAWPVVAYIIQQIIDIFKYMLAVLVRWYYIVRYCLLCMCCRPPCCPCKCCELCECYCAVHLCCGTWLLICDTYLGEYCAPFFRFNCCCIQMCPGVVPFSHERNLENWKRFCKILTLNFLLSECTGIDILAIFIRLFVPHYSKNC